MLEIECIKAPEFFKIAQSSFNCPLLQTRKDFCWNLEMEQVNRIQEANWRKFNIFKSTKVGNQIIISRKRSAVAIDKAEAKKLYHALNLYLRRCVPDDEPLDSPFTPIEEACNVWFEEGPTKRLLLYGTVNIGKLDGIAVFRTQQVRELLQALLDCFLLMSTERKDFANISTKLKCLELQVDNEPDTAVSDRWGPLYQTSDSERIPFCQDLFRFTLHKVKKPLVSRRDMCQHCLNELHRKDNSDIWTKRAKMYYERPISSIYSNDECGQIPEVVTETILDDTWKCCYQYLSITKKYQHMLALNKDQILACITRVIAICEWKKNILDKRSAARILNEFDAACNSKFPEFHPQLSITALTTNV